LVPAVSSGLAGSEASQVVPHSLDRVPQIHIMEDSNILQDHRILAVETKRFTKALCGIFIFALLDVEQAQ